MKKIVLTLLSCTLLLCGCTQSNIVASEGDRVPDTEIRGGIEIEWGQVWDDLDAQFLDKELYPFSESVSGNIVSEENRIDLVLLVNEVITKEEAGAYATEVVKGLNDSVSTQDFSFNPSEEDFYGDFISNNDVTILVAPATTFEDSSTWILEDTIRADEEYRPVGSAPAAE